MKKQSLILCCFISFLFSCKKEKIVVSDSLQQVACLDMNENFKLAPRFTQNNGKVYAWIANLVRPKIIEFVEIDNNLSKKEIISLDFTPFKYSSGDYYVEDNVLTTSDGKFILTKDVHSDVILLDVKNKKFITGYSFKASIRKLLTEENRVFALGTDLFDATKFYLYELNTTSATATIVQTFTKKAGDDISEPIIFNLKKNTLSLNMVPQNTSTIGERMQNFKISDGKLQNISLFSSKRFSNVYSFDESMCFVKEKVDGPFKAFDYNGTEIAWNSDLNSPSSHFTNILIHGERLYFSPNDGFVYCLDKKTGIVLWKTAHISHANKIFVHNNMVYVYSKNSGLSAFDPQNGDLRLKQLFGEPSSDCFFNKENNLIYIATYEKICSFSPL